MELNFPKIEEKILKFWQENKIFEKSIEQWPKDRNFVFYEGPPTANGRPGIHHVLARIFKDIICRYKTMQGFRVVRKAGWDTHGLPVELEVEKKLGIKSKPEIEKYGIAEFNKKCKESVWQYKKEWEELTERIGFWLDMENPYITYEPEYIESVWWIIKQIWQKGLLYKGHKVVPYCSRCETGLSSHEVAQGYENVEENSVYVKFQVKKQPNTYLLVWTTTPWTLPSNVAVAVNSKINYVKVKVGKEILILAKDRIDILDVEKQIIQEIKGSDLINLEYEPLFNFEKPDKKAFFVITGDFVSTEEGTGLVHIAPAFGEDDMEAGKKNNLPVLMTVDVHGRFKPEIKPWAGMFVKDADQLIIDDLKNRGLLFKEELYEHDYPFCWRCKSPLLYYAKESWFIDMQKIKDDLIENNQKINWIPIHLKEGRFGEWLKEVKDWAISRERYWGTPLPIWQCEKCNEKICIGSIEELNQKSGLKLKDLHRPFVDEVTFRCEKCGGEMQRVTEVIDCWFDSGAMPFAQYHYPFENKKIIDDKEQFPAEYISEAIDQTRGWFYTLLAISSLLGFGTSYKNVISLSHVLDEKGEKMSKSKGNIVDPWDIIKKYGVESVRWYFYTVNQPGEPKLFSEKDVDGALKRFLMIFWNCFVFFEAYNIKNQNPGAQLKSQNLLDRWIISKLNSLILDTTKYLDNYDITSAARGIEKFVVADLSQWYIRRSRRRFQKPKTEKELNESSNTLGFVLSNLTKLLAPFIPFLSEEIYSQLSGKKKSIHLVDWPKSDKELINQELKEKMEEAREIVALILAERAKLGIKVRQPLASLQIPKPKTQIPKELLELVKDEVNVKEITFGKDLKLDVKITAELKEEGQIREIIRNIQAMRKKAGLKPQDKIIVGYSGTPDLNKVIVKNKKFILQDAKVKDLILKGERADFDLEKEIKVDEDNLWLAIKKI